MTSALFGLSMSTLVPLAVFGMFAAVGWFVLELLSARSRKAESRLDEFRDPKLRQRRDAERAKVPGAMTRVLERATPALARPLQPTKEADASKLKLKLAHAGFRSETASTIFLGLKIASLLCGVMLGGGSVLALQAYDQMSLLKGVGFAISAFYFPDIVLYFLAKRRKEGIFLGLPDALDLMVVCVEAGLGLDAAMRKVADEMKKSYRIIAEEFGLCNLQLQMGRPRSEVLKDMGRRSGVEDLQSLASILIQADKFGSSIAQALRVQSESMRTRRRQIAEEKAAKTAVKLIFPLVLFIFPGIFVVLVGPAAITMVREMFPRMGGG